MDWSLWFAFLIASSSLAIMPGPDNIYVLTESLARGAKQGIGITIGLVCGVIIHTLLVASGLSLVVFKFDWTYDLLKYIGSAYLLYLAYLALKERKVELSPRSMDSVAEPITTLIKRGFLMNVLNPKVSIFFIAFLPQFVGKGSWTPFIQLVFLGITFMLVSFVIFSTLALLSGRAIAMIKTKNFSRISTWLKVFVLFSLSLLLLFSERG